MTSTTIHPLAQAWLRDLELLLHGIDPGERAEVLAGVHEHLDASLTPASTEDDVRSVLAELGPPQAIADEAYAGRPPQVLVSPPGAPAPRPGVMARGWVPVLVGLGLALSLVLVTIVAAVSGGYSTSSSSSMDASGQVTLGVEEVSYPGAFPGGAFWALLILSWLWFAPLFLCLASPLWTTREKMAAALVLPAAAVFVTALPDLGWALTGATTGINVGAWTGLALAAFGGGYVVLRIWKFGSMRAQELERGGRP